MSARDSTPGDGHPGLNQLAFGALSLALGVGAGLGAFVFRTLIALVHNLAFLRHFSTAYDTNQHTPASPWGVGVVLVPVAGAALVVFLIRRFAPEAKGHGVPEVMDAIYYNKSVIRPVVALVKSIASAISIGTGGSVGREGPIVQISASLASLSGSLGRASRWQRATLVAAGGGAGIAATFNAPIGGALFAVEVLLHEVSARTLVPVALATTTATFVGRFLFINAPAFPVPVVPLVGLGDAAVLPAAIVLGAAMALVSVAFIRLLYGTEDFLEKWIPGRDYLRHTGSMLVVGVVAFALLSWKGHYYVQGVGYATIMDVLSGSQNAVWFLVLLAALKLLVTCLTLGSGGSGGIFSPALFMGATLGGAYGVGLHALFPALAPDPRVFALAGMAAVVAGTTGAVLTAVVMMFEMTLDYRVVLPLTLAAAVSYGLRRYVCPDNIYTMKLTRRGHAMPDALQANAQLVHHVSDMSLMDVTVLLADSRVEALKLGDPTGPSHFAVVRNGAVVGVLTREWALSHADLVTSAKTLGDIAQGDFVLVPSTATLIQVLSIIERAPTSDALVVETGATIGRGQPPSLAVHGIVTKARIAEALVEGMELFED